MKRRTIIGNPARREKFFPRTRQINEILESLKDDANLLISAPRRVGKSSILWHFVDEPPEDYYMVYVDTEAIRNLDDFFRELMNQILDSDALDRFGRFKKGVMDNLKSWANRLKSITITEGKVDIGAPDIKDYYEEFVSFLENIDLEGKQIVVMVDEFPVTVENIIEEFGESGENEAREFLRKNRTIRLNPKLNGKVKFIYSGSIGLLATVQKFGATAEVNDLTEIKIGALTEKEALQFVSELLEGAGLLFDEDRLKEILEIIEWWIPIHFQMLVRELKWICEEKEVIGKVDIIAAFEEVVKNASLYFDHYRSRLRKTFKGNEGKYVMELLTLLASTKEEKETLVLDLAIAYEIEHPKAILNSLEYDGYIVREKGMVRFYSPILKAWWQRNV